jgi:hypothetical protein
MVSNPGNLFGGGEVEFIAAPGAKIYRWYASLNNAPYEYIGLTTTPAFSERFPAGTNKVKVIMDDCNSLKESNDQPFTMGSISPSFGSLAGGNIIYIYGDFPYAATSEYAAQANLAAHFDGINNRGLGDKQHDFNATHWKDLKSNFELPRGDGQGQWLSNGFQVLDNDTAFSSLSYPTNFPSGDHERTVEVIFRTPENMFTQQNDVYRHIFSYGDDLVTAQIFGVLYRGITASRFGAAADACGENPWVFYAIYGSSDNLATCLSSTPDLETANTINTVTSTYAYNINNAQYTNSYINNLPAVVLARGSYPLNTVQGPVRIGENLSGSTFLSVRLYNRVLTSEEIELNAELDQKRYLTPPSVTIDDKPCTEVVVLSPHFLMCRVPTGLTGTGDKEVKLNGVAYTNYKCVDPDNDFYISNISPIVGSLAGGTI